MYNNLERYIALNISVTAESLNQITACFKPINVRKGDMLVLQGERCKRLYFVNSGCVRTYYTTKQGSEKTRLIALEGMIITAMSAFISGQPSFETVEAVEHSNLLYITHADFYKLVEELPEWRLFYLRLLELAYIYQNKRIGERTTQSARERYAILMKEQPQYILRLSNKILASYLDITQETLSRLKSE
ncbi:MAG TPA: Crp/Fnr family transcriptional regulator [Mucilaginibacter sp.]|nr:Crp/Fnr family transcriptional regulator [Mucilaginibacter sp.]